MRMRMLVPVLALVFAGSASGQETTIRGFTDLNFTATDRGAASSWFSLGQYDMYIASELTDRISFLGETVFEFDDGFLIDVERVLVKYEFSGAFNIVVGKHHTEIGYWNTAYHHGSLLQPTTTRPLPFLFEDEGGALPIHTTGLLLTGSDLGKWGFGYSFMLGNGIGGTPTGDNNSAKSVSLSLTLQPVDGLEFGLSAYRDKVAAGTESLQGSPLPVDMQQQILTASVVVFREQFEFIGEFLQVSNDFGTRGATTTSAFYAYAGYRLGRVTPYLRYDSMSYENGELYFVKNDATLLVLGARYDFNYLATLKVELQNFDTQADGTVKSLTTQIAIGF